MASSEGWITYGFGQSSDDVWSTSTGVVIAPNNRETNMLRAGVDLASGIEEVVSTIAQKQSGPVIPERQAWESVAALAEGKLKSLARQEQTKNWLLEPAGVLLTSSTATLPPPQTDKNFLTSSNDALGQAYSMSSRVPQHRVSLRPQTGFEILNHSLFSSDSLIPDWSLQANPYAEASTVGQLFGAPSNGHPNQTREESFDSIQLEPEPQMSAQVLSLSQQLNYLDDFNIVLAIPGQDEHNTASDQATALTVSEGSFQAVAAHHQSKGGIQKRAATGKVAQSRVSNRIKQFQQQNVREGSRSLLNLQEQLAAETKETNQLLRLRRGRPSERGESCAYCNLHKKKCVGAVPCESCRKSRVYRTLCVPASFKESRSMSHRLYFTRISTLLDNIAQWIPESAGLEPITIKISNGFQAHLEIELRPYIPYDYEALTHVVFRGLEGGMIPPRVKSTAFALREKALSPEKIDRYCDSLCREFVVREASQQRTFANHVLMFALNQCQVPEQEKKLRGLDMVEMALRFWAMQSVFFNSPWTIVEGASRVGMSPMEIPGFWHGLTFLPRLVNQELDRAFERHMDELEKEILDRLQRAVFTNHRTLWCSVFLTCFIVLHGLEKDSWNMRAWECETQRLGGTFWPLREQPRDYCNQNQHIADIVASHFRVVNKGHTPFAVDWKKISNQQLVRENPAAQQFVKEIQSELKEPNSTYRQQLCSEKHFKREDVTSLSYLYTKKLVID